MLNEPVRLAIIGAVLLLFQVALGPLIEVHGARPDLLLIFVLVVTARNGYYGGLAAGFLTGLIQDAVSVGFIGVLALAKSSVAFWSGLWLAQRGLSLGIWGWTLLVFSCALVQDMLAALFLLQGSPVSLGAHLWRTVLPSAVYTALIACLWTLAPLGERSRQPLRPLPVKPRKVLR